jgi:dienelactone hydrolase
VSIIKGEKARVVTLFGTITVPSGSRSLAAYLARPDLRGEWPTVVVFGGADAVGSPIKELCRHLARQGFAVVAPENTTSAAARGGAIEFVVNPTAAWSNAERGYGVIGVEGGGIPAVAEAGSRRLVSAVALISSAPSAETLARVSAPILGLSGRADPDIPGDRIEAVRAAAPRAEWVVYSDVGADFWNDAAPGWDQEAAADAVDRLAAFFGQQLPPVAT